MSSIGGPCGMAPGRSLYRSSPDSIAGAWPSDFRAGPLISPVPPNRMVAVRALAPIPMDEPARRHRQTRADCLCDGFEMLAVTAPVALQPPAVKVLIPFHAHDVVSHCPGPAAWDCGTVSLSRCQTFTLLPEGSRDGYPRHGRGGPPGSRFCRRATAA